MYESGSRYAAIAEHQAHILSPQDIYTSSVLVHLADCSLSIFFRAATVRNYRGP